MAPPFEGNTRQLLDTVTHHFLETGEQISGKRLRKAHRMEREPFNAAMAALVPIYVEQVNSQHNDLYSPTLRGMLESSSAVRSMRLVESVLKRLRHEFEEDPDVRWFTWAKMRESDATLTNADYQAVLSLLSCARLSNGINSDAPSRAFRCHVPNDIEDLVKLDTARLLASRIQELERKHLSDVPNLPLPTVLLRNDIPEKDKPAAPHSGLLESAPQPLDDDDTSTLDLIEPFDPAKIRIETKVMTVDLLLKRLKEQEIDLMPDFQREGGLWKEREQSRLIESLLVRIPIPAFYMDATNEERWLVVDGLQRLTVFKRFILDGTLELSQLEFLRQFEGMKFQQLPRPMQRRIEETQVTVSLIQPGTPEDVRYYLFKRINTGGLPLTPQEIRHALNQGPASKLLAELAREEVFIQATGGSLRAQRMADRECILRFFAFRLTSIEHYRSQDLDGFLNDAMRQMNKMESASLEELSRSFLRAMKAAHEILGRYAFRKRTQANDRMNPINKALFETWSVNLSLHSDDELARLTERREQVNQASMKLLSEDSEFALSVTQATGDAKRVRIRFERVAELLRGVLK
ncbi:MAG TPA: DUF262 domain-containing protein [Archangium sp.]|uniref:DUF262 domain-containing protein n=1 Tax=Archangium sp. TaxID=1872627 RepID=UPI002E314BE4|nr:DUF262 domain-containing protein [Archangium sp.]HEX5749471.1 DUF262 domain-containing protein [Archangium sp.]